MTRYLMGRVAGLLLTLVGVTALAFFATALAPGNPASVLLGAFATPERMAELTEQLGLDQPLVSRYLYWLRQVVQGELGESNLSHKPVAGLLAAALPVTLELTAVALGVSVLLALPMGLLVAHRRRSWWTKPLMAVVTIGLSVPGVWVGQLLILAFALTLTVLPSGGFVPFASNPTANITHIILPATTLAIYLTPALVRFVRVTAQAVLREDYVDTARSKGISNLALLAGHVAPNTWINTMTYVGLQLGVMLSGAIVVETIFALPGIGRLGLTAVLNRDYPVVQGVVLVASAGYVLVNLLIDIAYGLVDPRVRVR
jgi:peptide/nickel transport system permease protein